MAVKQRGINLSLGFFSFGILEQGGGFENYVIETAAGLTDRYNDVEVEIITTTRKRTEQLQGLLSVYHFRRHARSNIYRESISSIKQRLKAARYTQVSTLKAVKHELNKHDVIYVKNEILELVILKAIGFKKLPPVVMGVHTPIYYPFTPSLSAKLHNLLYTGFFYKFLIKGAYAIKVNNADDKQFVEQKLNFKNVSVVHHAFDVEVGKIHTSNDKFNILFVGRLTEQKGVDVLVDVISQLSEGDDFDNYEIKIAGTGEQSLTNSLNQLAERLPNVKMLGHIPNDQIEKLYDWTDVTIIPSKYETLNKVAIETAIAGKISISSDIPGPREVIENNKTGYLVDLKAKIFVDKIIELKKLKHNDPYRLRNIGLAAQHKIKKDFSPNKVYADFYEQFINSKKTPNV